MIASALRAGPPLMSLAHRGGLRLGLVLVGLVCLLCIQTIDQPVALWVHAQIGEDARAVIKLASRLGEGYAWYGGGLVLLLAAAPIRRFCRLAATEALWWRIQRAALYFLGAHLAASLAVPVLKVLIGRLRPKWLYNHGIYDFVPLTFRMGDVCFPSGHTQTIVTAAVALAFILPDRRVVVPMAVLALLVGASRVLLGAHFVADVLMGAYVGAAAAVLVHRAFLRRGWTVRLLD